MASPNTNFTDLVTTTFNDHAKTMADNFFSSFPLLKKLEAKTRISKDGGNKIVRPLMYADNSTVKFFSGYETLDITPQTGFSAAEYDWRECNGTVTISNIERLKNSGKNQIRNLLNDKKMQLEKSLRKKFNLALMSDGTGVGTGFADSEAGKVPLGIKAIVGDDNSGVTTVGNISASSNTWWRSYCDRNGGVARAWDLDLWKKVYNKASVGTGEFPDLIFTTLDLYLAYEASQHPMLRYAPNDETANAMFTGLQLGGALVFWDDMLTHDGVNGDDTYFLNTDYIEFVTHQDSWFTMGEAIKVPDKAAIWIQCFSTCQLVTNNRRMHGLITNQTS